MRARVTFKAMGISGNRQHPHNSVRTVQHETQPSFPFSNDMCHFTIPLQPLSTVILQFVQTTSTSAGLSHHSQASGGIHAVNVVVVRLTRSGASSYSSTNLSIASSTCSRHTQYIRHSFLSGNRPTVDRRFGDSTDGLPKGQPTGRCPRFSPAIAPCPSRTAPASASPSCHPCNT